MDDGSRHLLPAPCDLPGIMAALDIGDEYLWVPDRLVPFEHWVGHIPFAFWLTKALHPRMFVELGTHRGNSYCAMCQTVAAEHINAVGYAVDTWQGDVHMARETGLLDELRAYHDPRYGRFSTLMPMTFDSALALLPDQGIDLLHIDGTHTYDAASHDFQAWLPKLSDRGVVMFHDINVRRDDFGVWRLWGELEQRFPSFSFPHSHGLGVVGVGSALPETVRTLFAMGRDPLAQARVRTLFATRGDALLDRYRVMQGEASAQSRDDEAARAQAQLDAMRAGAEVREAAAAARETALREAAAAAAETWRAESAEREARLRAEAAAELAARVEAHHAQEQSVREEAAREIQTLKARLDRRETVTWPQVDARIQASAARAQREIASRIQAEARLSHERQAREQDAREHRIALDNASAEALTAAALRQQLAEAHHTRLLAENRLAEIDRSTIWRMTYPLRVVMRRVPPGARRLARRGMRVVWWTATFQVFRRLRDYAGRRG